MTNTALLGVYINTASRNEFKIIANACEKVIPYRRIVWVIMSKRVSTNPLNYDRLNPEDSFFLDPRFKRCLKRQMLVSAPQHYDFSSRSALRHIQLYDITELNFFTIMVFHSDA